MFNFFFKHFNDVVVYSVDLFCKLCFETQKKC